jgi:hypothetical protein
MREASNKGGQGVVTVLQLQIDKCRLPLDIIRPIGHIGVIRPILLCELYASERDMGGPWGTTPTIFSTPVTIISYHPFYL